MAFDLIGAHIMWVILCLLVFIVGIAIMYKITGINDNDSNSHYQIELKDPFDKWCEEDEIAKHLLGIVQYAREHPESVQRTSLSYNIPSKFSGIEFSRDENKYITIGGIVYYSTYSEKAFNGDPNYFKKRLTLDILGAVKKIYNNYQLEQETIQKTQEYLQMKDYITSYFDKKEIKKESILENAVLKLDDISSHDDGGDAYKGIDL